MAGRSVRFSTQLLLLQVGILLVISAAGLGVLRVVLRSDLVQDYEQRALAIARSVAADDRYASAVASGDPAGEVQLRAEAVRRRTGALFVVVTDAQGRRYSHPVPSLLGRRVNLDEPQALDGREVTLLAPSAVGRSARGKVPLRGPDGAIVGEVIAAIDANQIDDRLADLVRTFALLAAGYVAFGSAGAVVLTRRLRRQTFGLEPAGLRLLLEQQEALRRVATLVARGVPPTAVFDAVAAEVALILEADITGMARLDSDNTQTIVAARRDDGRSLGSVTVGSRQQIGEGDIGAVVMRTGSTVRVRTSDGPTGDIAAIRRELGIFWTIAAPIVVDGKVWGVMIAAWTRDEAPPDGAEGRMTGFTELVATAIANAAGRAQLAASRARVVAAADETRRRIERDLHDGTQQRLVSLALDLRAAEAALPPDGAEVKAQLSRAATGLVEAVADLQEISRGIHPAILARGGLGPALKGLARRSPVPVELAFRADERLPESVEVAAYFVVSEALTNAAKHAEATAVHVEMVAGDGSVRLSVHDDGIGGADPANGSGLIGLGDRVEALGGSIEIASPVGDGTSLVVTIPIDAS